MNNLNVITSSLKDDIKNFSSAVCKNAAQEVKKDLYETAEMALQRFYAYQPQYYDRHRANTGVGGRAFRPFYQSSHGMSARGGVELTPELLANDYDVSSDIVYNDVIFFGMHGPDAGNNIPVHITSPSPYQAIIDRRDYLLNNINEIIERAKSKALNEQKYILF